jgi:predicted double-glycine peptidase
MRELLKWIGFASLWLLAGCANIPFLDSKDSGSQRIADFDYCKVPVVKQGSQRSCGMAALVSLLQYWKEDPSISEKSLRKKYPPKSDAGYPMAQLKDVAVQEGLLAFAVTLDREPVAQLMEHLRKGRPVLVAALVPKGRYFGDTLPLVETLDRRVLVGLGNSMKHHYLVVMGMSGREVLLMDPQYGQVRTSRSQFQQFWKEMGYAALVTSAVPKGVEVASE